jgi:hypothetical protein
VKSRVSKIGLVNHQGTLKEILTIGFMSRLAIVTFSGVESMMKMEAATEMIIYHGRLTTSLGDLKCAAKVLCGTK